MDNSSSTSNKYAIVTALFITKQMLRGVFKDVFLI